MANISFKTIQFPGLSNVYTVPQIDNTNTIAGKAADAKKTGDDISQLKADLDDVNESLQDKVAKPTASPNGTNGQLLRTNGDGSTEWVDSGLPTDEQTVTAITAWLNAHPEATTTVQDHSLTHTKLVNGTLGFVTPEMYGAVGDGVTDDTTAWQNAVDSGYNVKAPSGKIYKIGKVTITNDIDIDCGMSKFIQTNREMFYATGSPEETTGTTGDYTHDNNGYVLSDANKPNYTGYAFLQGTNDLDLSRAYYKSGFVACFKNGYMVDAYPVDVTNITVTYYSPITVSIRNILDIEASNAVKDLANTYSIHIKYGVNCSVCNVLVSDVHTYMLIDIDRCINTVIDQVFTHSNAQNASDNSYHIAIMDSCFSYITNCKLNNEKWHCITTGGTALVYKTTVRDCVLNTKVQYAYCDHPNAIDTVIDNVIATFGIYVTHKAKISNSEIYAHDDANNFGIAKILLFASNFNHLGYFTIENVNIYCNRNTRANNAGIVVEQGLGTGGVYSTRYINLISTNNVYVIDPTATKTFGGQIYISNSNLDNPVYVYKIHLENTNVSYLGNDDASNNVDLSSCTYKVRGMIYKTVNGSSLLPFGSTDYTMPVNVFMDDCEFSYLRGNYTNIGFGTIKFITFDTSKMSITGEIYGNILKNTGNLTTFTVLKDATGVRIGQFKYSNDRIGMCLCKHGGIIGFLTQYDDELRWACASSATSWSVTGTTNINKPFRNQVARLQDTAPTINTDGQLWYDTTNNKLKISSSNSWVDA